LEVKDIKNFAPITIPPGNSQKEFITGPSQFFPGIFCLTGIISSKQVEPGISKEKLFEICDLLQLKKLYQYCSAGVNRAVNKIKYSICYGNNTQDLEPFEHVKRL
jgi:hypothetical protein